MVGRGGWLRHWWRTGVKTTSAAWRAVAGDLIVEHAFDSVPNLGTVLDQGMCVISRKTLKEFWEKHADSEQPLRAWFHETKHANWKSFSDIKARHRSADLLPGNRVVFNIKGNTYRLIVRIHFNTGIAFIRFIGTHAAYDKIDATTA